MSLNLDGKSTRVRSGGMPAVVAKMKELEASKANVLKLHAGDAVSGSLFLLYLKAKQMPLLWLKYALMHLLLEIINLMRAMPD